MEQQVSDNILSYIETYCDLFKRAIRDGDNIPEIMPMIANRYSRTCGVSPAKVDRMSSLLFKLPPLIARKKAQEYFGGVITSRTLANADYMGIGPRVRWKINGCVCYPTPYLLEWMEEMSHDVKM